MTAPYPPSWYAASTAPLPPQPPLDGDLDADVCILGAGYVGLSTALALAEAGYRVVVLEASASAGAHRAATAARSSSAGAAAKPRSKRSSVARTRDGCSTGRWRASA